MPITARCPVCFCESGFLLYTVNAEQASQHYVLKQTNPVRFNALKMHIETLWGQRRCSVVRCASCGFCFADPFVAGDARFYELAYERRSYPTWKWEFECTRTRLLQLVHQGRLRNFKILEVGAGDGAFIKRVTPSMTSRENVLCTEYSDYGRDQIESYGVPCFSMDVRVLPLEEYGKSFDVICMFQVLEHLDKLDDLFAQLNRLSKEKAHLFIAVPNAKRIEFNELNGSLLDMPPNHIGRWNRPSFEIISRRHGWRMVEHKLETESLWKKTISHLMYLYLQERQDARTFANRIEAVSARSLRRMLQAAAIGLYAFKGLPALYALLTSNRLGTSQWVHLRKGA